MISGSLKCGTCCARTVVFRCEASLSAVLNCCESTMPFRLICIAWGMAAYWSIGRVVSVLA